MDTILYWSIFVLNIVVPVVEGILVICLNYKKYNAPSDSFPLLSFSLNISEYSVGLLQIVSGCLLIYAMIKIVKFIKKGLKSP